MAKLGAVKSDEEVPKAVLNIVDPSIYDDETAGHTVSEIWVNSATDQTFVCVDADTGAAVWKKLTDQGGGTPSWGAITGTLSAQTDLAGALNGKVADNDSRLSDARTPTAHSHSPSEVTGTAVITSDSRLSDARTPTAHSQAISTVTNLQTTLDGKAASSHSHSPSEVTGTAVITNDSRLSDARTPLAHNQAISTVTSLQTTLDGKEAANANIQTHVTSAHAPANAQANADITKAEIEAKLTGQITSHTHAGGAAEFPIGWLLISAVNTNPATFLGYGTWANFGAGRVLVGLDSGDTDFDTAEETGGAKTNTPSAHAGTAVGNHTNVAVPATATAAIAKGTSTVNVAAQTHTHTIASIVHSVTQPSAHSALSVVQPYIVVYFWKRTA